jgi:anti-sigma B factor antagonist
MAFPSKDAPDATRPLFRPRGVGAALLKTPVLRDLALMVRTKNLRGYRTRLRHGRSRHHTEAVRPPEATPQVAQESAPARGLKVEEVGHDGVERLVLIGELDSRSVPTLEAAISRCCAAGTRAVTLDLSRLTFIDSSGLWTITSVRKWCERQGYGFSLIPGPPSVQRVFEVTGLSDVLPFRKDGSSEVRTASERPVAQVRNIR